MSKRINIKPPNWSKELTFEEFNNLNPLIKENQRINLYNQYLAKFLNELAQQKLHFKQSLNDNLQLEINKFQKKYTQTLLDTELKYPNINYDNPRGPGNPPYGKGLGAEGKICFSFSQTIWTTGSPSQLQPSGIQSQLNSKTVILTATDGTEHIFTTPAALAFPTYLDFLLNFTLQINNHPLFTAQFIGLNANKAVPDRIVCIIIQQYLPGAGGNTTIEGNLELSELVTYTDFSGGTDG